MAHSGIRYFGALLFWGVFFGSGCIGCENKTDANAWEFNAGADATDTQRTPDLGMIDDTSKDIKAAIDLGGADVSTNACDSTPLVCEAGYTCGICTGEPGVECIPSLGEGRCWGPSDCQGGTCLNPSMCGHCDGCAIETRPGLCKTTCVDRCDEMATCSVGKDGCLATADEIKTLCVERCNGSPSLFFEWPDSCEPITTLFSQMFGAKEICE